MLQAEAHRSSAHCCQVWLWDGNIGIARCAHQVRPCSIGPLYEKMCLVSMSIATAAPQNAKEVLEIVHVKYGIWT